MPNDSGLVVQSSSIKLSPVVDSGEFAQLLDSDRFAQIQRVAKLYSESDFVTDAFRGKVANCAIAIQSAIRLHIDPVMLMQHCYLVHGKPGMEGQLVIALVNARGPFKGPLQWKVEGTGETRQWTCYATHKITGELCQRSITWSIVKAEGWLDKAGSKWKTMPDQMGCYRSASWFARLYCPEVLLGFQTADELEDIGEREVSGERIDEPQKPIVERIKDKVRERDLAPETAGDGSAQPANESVRELAKTAAAALAKTAAAKTPDSGLEPAPHRSKKPVFTFAALAQSLNEAKTATLVDDWEAVIDAGIEDAAQRAELHDLAKARRLELSQ